MKREKRDFWQDGPARGQAACCRGAALVAGDRVMVHTGNAWRHVRVLAASDAGLITATCSGFFYKSGRAGKPRRWNKASLYFPGAIPGNERIALASHLNGLYVTIDARPMVLDNRVADFAGRAALPPGYPIYWVHVMSAHSGVEIRGYALVGDELRLRLPARPSDWPEVDEAVLRAISPRAAQVVRS